MTRATLRFLIAGGIALDVHIAAAMLLSRNAPLAPATATASIFVDVAIAAATRTPSLEARGPANVPAIRSSPRRSSPPPAAQASHALVAFTAATSPTSEADRYPCGFTHPFGTSPAPVFDPYADPFGVHGGSGNAGGVELSAFAHPIDRIGNARGRCARTSPASSRSACT